MNVLNNPTGKILVVDDHAAARESMAEIRTSAGHQVRCCASAIAALRELERVTFDVIITDLRMPGMTGLEFIRALEQRRCDSQIVMVTAHGSVAAAVEAAKSGELVVMPTDTVYGVGADAFTPHAITQLHHARGSDRRVPPPVPDLRSRSPATFALPRDRPSSPRAMCGSG